MQLAFTEREGSVATRTLAGHLHDAKTELHEEVQWQQEAESAPQAASGIGTAVLL
jgi:hypothetical protein